ncbi:YjeF N-terminal domain-containing protein [Dioszegia hungarica]|uniref:NAD(P)H-hydrate epimerase n=1 Tax=Dioszegia hungarica TaxID=4972 RepID=A0AA38H8F4_9TREE|nr:YjeF N-terminal domain-containing protein [Dioszegia hungarica]KAI9635376.1 YjeF N-terminal domain-containing protein [Dioszegia hungarica]
MSIRFISQKIAQQIDEELMSSSGAFSLDQLMELAGLACAQAVAKTYPVNTHPRVLVCCGPGNQGGDGLVAARHLHHFRYKPTIYLPKPGSKDIYQRLLKQCENLEIPVLKSIEELEKGVKETDVILDAIFGFSFHPPLRRPFDRILALLGSSSAPILSIDIPSGWDVERGRQKLETEPDENGKVDVVETFVPDALISLTVPKKGVREFKGRHWLGGRFVPDALAKKLELNLPEYGGVDQVVELSAKL